MVAVDFTTTGTKGKAKKGRGLSCRAKFGILVPIMRIKMVAEDFIVEEVLAARLAQGGRYAVYRARKRAITTLQLQHRLAAALNRPHSAVTFPALKDKQAVAVQFGTVRGPGPLRVAGHGFTAERVGWLDWPLSPNDVAGNRFTVTLRDLGEAGAFAAGDESYGLADIRTVYEWWLMQPDVLHFRLPVEGDLAPERLLHLAVAVGEEHAEPAQGSGTYVLPEIDVPAALESADPWVVSAVLFVARKQDIELDIGELLARWQHDRL